MLLKNTYKIKMFLLGNTININEGTEKQVFPCNPYALLCDIKT